MSPNLRYCSKRCPLAELENIENLPEPQYFDLDIDPLTNIKE